MTTDLKSPFANAVAHIKFFLTTEVASAPPHKVRTILQNEGWQFEPIQVDPGLVAGTAAFGGHYGIKYLPMFAIKSPTGQDIHTSGNEALYKLYTEALKRAARKAYLTPDAP